MQILYIPFYVRDYSICELRYPLRLLESVESVPMDTATVLGMFCFLKEDSFTHVIKK